MNRKKDVIAIVKKLLFSQDEIKMEAQGKLVDGTIVMTPDSEIKEGVELFVISEDGTSTPAPDGTHELEDGTFVKTEGGFVVSVERNEGDDIVETELEEVKSGDDVLEVKATIEQMMAEHEKNLMEKITMFEEKLTALEQKFEEVAGEITSNGVITEEFSKVKEATKLMFEEFVNQPTGKAVDTDKASFDGEFSSVKNNTNSKSEKMKDLIKFMNKG
jgi:hypothetical protein